MDSGTGIKVTHILLIEDDKGHQDLVLRAFRNDPETFRVSVAGNLREARQILERDLPDLILSDWVLPDGKGLDILVRTDGAVTIPLVIMTSYGDEHLAVEIMKSGAIDYVVKSATAFNDLPHIVRRALHDWENIHERKRADKAVRDSEKRLADIIEFLPDAVLAIDNKGRVIAWNEAIEQITGVAATDMLGKGDHEYSIPLYGERRPILVDLVLGENPEIEKKYPFLQRDGERLTSEIFLPILFGGKGASVWFTASPLYDSSGNRVGAIEIIRDITERKQNEELLRQREATLETLLNAPKDTIALLDPQGIILELNEEGARRLGGTVQSVTGRCAYDLLPSDLAQERKANINRVFETGKEVLFDDDRSGVFFHNEIYPIFNTEHTAVDRVAIFARDITERKRVEDALLQEKNYSDRLFDAPNDTVFLFEPSTGKPVRWNKRFSEESGYTDGEIAGMKAPRDFYDKAELNKATEYIARIYTGNVTVELSLVTKQGAHIPFEYSATPIETTDGRTLLLSIGRNITERKQAEIALQESEERYRLLFDSIDEGFCIIEMIFDEHEKPVDYRFLEVNPSFEKQTGIIDAQGRRMREIAPLHEEHWFEIYGKIALTGQPVRFMNRAEQLHRWYDVYAFRFGKPESRQVAILFNNINERKQAEENLRESEERFRHISDLITDIAYSCKRPTGGVYSLDWISGAFGRITGFSDNEILAMGCWRGIVIEEDYPIFDEKITGLLPGISSQCDLRIRSKDGVIHWLSCFTECVSDPAYPEYHILFGGCRDITENKKAEEIRNAYQVRLDSAMDIGSLAWWEMDLPDGAVRFDDRKAIMLGYQPEKFRHYTDFTQILHPDDDKPTMQAMKDHLEGKAARYHADYRIRTSEGIYRWFRDVGGITGRHPDGSPATVTGIVIDITAGRQAEEALRESEQLLSKVFDNANDAIFLLERTIDGPGKYLLVNDKAFRMLGYTKEELMAMSPRDIVPKDIAEKIMPDVIAQLLKDGHATFESAHRRKDGSIYPIEVSTHTFRYQGKDVDLSIVRDITERRKAEEVIRQASERLLLATQAGGIGIWELDLVNNRLIWDDQMFQLYGIRPDSFSGTYEAWRAGVHPDDLEQTEAELQMALRGEKEFDTEFRVVWPDTTIHSLHARARVHRDSSGKPLKLIGTNVDITSRHLTEEALRESEAHLRVLLHTIPDLVWLKDPQGVYLSCNQRFESFLGKAEKEIIGKTDYDFMDNDLADFFRQHDLAAIAAGGPTINEEEITFASDGHREVLETIKTPICGDDGKLIGVLGIGRDITGRKRMEEALRMNEQEFHTLAESMPQIVWITRPDGWNIYFNQQWVDYTGLSLEESYGHGWNIPFHPDDQQRAWDAWQRATQHNDTYSLECRLRRFDGVYRWWLIRGVPWCNANGEILKWFGTCTDIEDLKQAETDIRESETRFRALIHNSSDIIRILGSDGRILYESPSSERILGYPPGSLIGKDPMEFIHPDDVDRVKNDYQEVVDHKNPGTPTEFRIRKADGEYLWVDTIGANLLDTPGVNGIVVTTRPIQQRKLAEEQITMTIAQLERSEALLRNVYDILPIGLWLADKNGKLLYGNPAGVKIWGAEPLVPLEEYGVFKARRYPSGEEIAGDDWALAHTILEGVTIKDELLEIDAFDGKKKIIVNYTAPLYDAAGAIDGAIVVNQEVTDRVAAEQLLKISGKRLSLALEATSDGLWDWDLTTDHVYWSPRTFEMLGYAVDEFPVTYAVWKSLLHPDEREATEINVMTQLKSGNRFSAEFRYRTKNGSWMWILGRGRAVAWDTEGNVTRMVGTHVDLTGLKEAKAALHESEERLRLAMEGAKVASWDWDLISGKTEFSDRFYTMLDYQPGEFPATYEGWIAQMHPDDRKHILTDLQKQIQEKRPFCEIEYRIQDKDGDYLWILGRGKISETRADGTPSHMTGVNIDITNRKLMESEIRSLNTVLEERVKDRTEALVETNEKLEEENAQRLEAEGKLQASYDEKVMLLKEIHHRVKNNLQIIASLLNLQSRYITDEKTLAAIRESQNRVKAMALVHEKLYRSEDIAHISLHDYIRFLGTGLFQFYDARVRGIQFTLEISDIDVDIDAAIPLGLIINELISNSLKYAFPEGRTGEVSISVKKEGHTLNVLFHDTGIGIPADLDWRNAPSLGLRLVTTLVDQMDGTLELDRSDGTTFTMVLHEKEPRGEK